MTTEERLLKFAQDYGFEVVETDTSVTIRKFFKEETFEGCDRYHLAIKYIENF